jgi:hypothetical protein
MDSSCSILVPNDCAGSPSPKMGRPQHWLPTPFVIVPGRAGQHQTPCLVKGGFLYPFNAKGWARLPLNHLWSADEPHMNLWTTHEQAWFSTPYEPPFNCTWTPYEPSNHPWTSMIFNPLWTIFELHVNPIWTFEPPMNKHGFGHYPKRELVLRTSQVEFSSYGLTIGAGMNQTLQEFGRARPWAS